MIQEDSTTENQTEGLSPVTAFTQPDQATKAEDEVFSTERKENHVQTDVGETLPDMKEREARHGQLLRTLSSQFKQILDQKMHLGAGELINVQDKSDANDGPMNSNVRDLIQHLLCFKKCMLLTIMMAVITIVELGRAAND